VVNILFIYFRLRGAEMIAAQQFNSQNNNAIEIVYGCVATGSH
jgi:hypothetical protein